MLSVYAGTSDCRCQPRAAPTAALRVKHKTAIAVSSLQKTARRASEERSHLNRIVICPDPISLCASRRDILVKRRPRDADRLADLVNCMFLLTVQIDGHGTLLFTKLFSPAAFPAACSRGCQPRVRPFADQVTLKLRERPKI